MIAGQVDIPTRVEVRGDSRTDVGTTDVLPPVKKNTDRMNPAGQVDIPTRVEVHVTGGSWTCVGTTDVLLPVKNNTDRMNQLDR